MISDRTDTMSDYIDEMVKEKLDLRTALWTAFAVIRASNQSLSVAMDAIEARTRDFDSYEDMKIAIAEMEKEQRQKRLRGMFGS